MQRWSRLLFDVIATIFFDATIIVFTQFIAKLVYPSLRNITVQNRRLIVSLKKYKHVVL